MTYPVALTKGLRIHRETCKRIPGRIVGDVVTHRDATVLAGCCKPTQAEVNRQRQEAAAAHVEAEKDAASGRVEELLEQARTAVSAPPEPPVKRWDTTDPQGVLHRHADGTEHSHFARGTTIGGQVVDEQDGTEEHKHGILGDKTITSGGVVWHAHMAAPDLAAEGETAPETTDRGKLARRRAKELSNHRGKGTAISQEDLEAYARKVRAAHPESSRHDEQEYAYWIEGLAIGRSRWNAAWDAAPPAGSAAA